MLRQNRQTAFTLVELLIVLAILGSVSAFVAPNLWNSLERSRERQAVQAFGVETLSLRRELRRQYRGLAFGENALTDPAQRDLLPALRAGWSVESNSNLHFLPSGVCTGGDIVFRAPSGRRWRLHFAMLDGQISVSVV